MPGHLQQGPPGNMGGGGPGGNPQMGAQMGPGGMGGGQMQPSQMQMHSSSQMGGRMSDNFISSKIHSC